MDKLTMQRRHFQLIAEAIRTLEYLDVVDEGRQELDGVAEHFADVLQRTNPGFNRERFIAACKEKP